MPQYVRPMLSQGYLRERSSHVAGGRQRRKAYFLTLAGRKEATRIRTAFLDKPVTLESEGQRRTTTLRDALRDAFPGNAFLAVLRGIDEEGILRAPLGVPETQNLRRPSGPNVEEARRALERARAFETRHDWEAAGEAYNETLDLLTAAQPGIRAEASERGALCSFRGAFQADSHETFRARMTQALERYETMRGSRSDRPQADDGRAGRSEAMTAYARYWLATDAPGKRAALFEVRRLTRESLRAFDAAGEDREYGRTFNELAFGVFCSAAYQDTREGIFAIDDELIEWGERAIKLLEPTGDRVELAKACTIVSPVHRMRGARAPTLQDDADRMARERWERAVRLSEPEAYGSLRNGPSLWGIGTEEAYEVYEKALEQAKEWKDVLGIAYAHDNLSFNLFWRAQGLEDVAAQVELYKQALRHALDSKRFSEILGHERLYLGGFWPGNPFPDYYWILAELETDREKKRELLERVRAAVPNRLAWAGTSGAPRVIAAEHSFVGDVFAALSRLEDRPENRQRLLEEALGHAEKGVALAEPVEIILFNLGWIRDDLARILADLSDLSHDRDISLNYLRRAIDEKERSLRLYMEGEIFDEGAGDPGGLAEIGKRWYELGGLYVRLASRLNDREPLKKALKAYQEAVGSYEKLGLSSRIAECHWRAAQAQDSSGLFAEAAESFRRASEAFGAAATRIPSLKPMYQDHTFFMEAWVEIEEGRARHLRRDYGRARENFEKSAILHRASRRWAHLAPNYLAWARLEEAEDESRREKSSEAVRAFREAARLFDETGRSLRAMKKDIEDPEEDGLVTRLSEAAVLRKKYCQARIIFEEGRTLEESGDPAAAAEKYRLATEQFEALLKGLESDEDRRDVGLILALSKASHWMARAESTGSATDYRDAAALFEEAAELSDDERSRLIAQGHGRLCRAWDAGTRFLDTRDLGAYAAALEDLRRAEDCYRRAGVDRSATHARASRTLFDAWNQLEEADRARSPEERARGYKAAERMLRLAATGLEKAGQPRLHERVIGLLLQIGEERELAVSLADVLRAPAMAVSTSAFSTPAQTHERSTGLNPIEHADLQASLIARRRSVGLTERLPLKIEFVNAGRAAARLLRIDALIPEGFELLRTARTHAVVGGSLDLKGRRLEPLQSDAVTLTLSSRNEGIFQMAPQILYLDESGTLKACRPAPLEITVARPAKRTGSRSSRRP